MYKPGGTIADALSRIQTKSYVLPAIQRDFVWTPEHIEPLFDSLMRGIQWAARVLGARPSFRPIFIAAVGIDASHTKATNSHCREILSF